MCKQLKCIKGLEYQQWVLLLFILRCYKMIPYVSCEDPLRPLSKK